MVVTQPEQQEMKWGQESDSVEPEILLRRLDTLQEVVQEEEGN